MTPAETNRCCICKKVFCCAECRKLHEKKKHPFRKLNCPLCNSQKLQLQIFEDKSLLCHIVLNHLPLYCCLCGETFKHNKDIESFGECKWWQFRHRHSLVSNEKPVLGTPLLVPEIKGIESINAEYNNGNFCSPPELHRNTSTPMVVGQKTSFEFKTPSIPNFSLKTPKTNSAASTKNQTNAISTVGALSLENDSKSKYVSRSSSTSQNATPIRSFPQNYNKNQHLPRANSAWNLDIMKKGETINETNEHLNDDHVEDMELTGAEGNALPDIQSLEPIAGKVVKQSESIKRVRFSDEYVQRPVPSPIGVLNITENEYFEARETISEVRDSDNSWASICKGSKSPAEKESKNVDGNAIVDKQLPTSSRVLMMVVVENNAVTSQELVGSGLKNLDHTSSNSPGCSLASTSSYYSVSSYESYSSTSTTACNRELKALDNTKRPSSVGIFSAIAHSVRSLMKNLTGAGGAKTISREHVSQRENIAPNSSPINTSISPSLASSLLPRSGKRSRDAGESVLSPPRQIDVVGPQVELRSPLAKRHRGWCRARAREPIARMRNNVVSPPRGISSETQIFSQGSLLVGDTVLPLPARAHQSSETE